MTKVIVVTQRNDCSHLEGQFLNESHYDTLIQEDTDCYILQENEDFIAFKFRKNHFSKQEQDAAYAGLREAATQSQNRGMAAGPKAATCIGRDWVTEFQMRVLEHFKVAQEETVIETNINDEIESLRIKYKNVETTRGMVWLGAKVKEDEFNFDKWLREVVNLPVSERKREANEVYETYISDTTYANPVFSGIAGWFDRYPRIPYGRATSFTAQNFDKFKLAFPFLQTLNKGFKTLLPNRWQNQKNAVDKIDPAFVVPGTVFTTITVNKTFRTAAHYDAGDFSQGLSNLLVLSNNGNYSGGYLVLPEIRMAIDVRPGDLLLVNNHECMHGNTPIVLQDDEAERISLVCYLREKMLELGSKEYEDLRYQFVESRRKNPEHPMQRRLWNGISEGMWSSQEWYDFLEQHGGREMLDKYHPEANEKVSSLDSFF